MSPVRGVRRARASTIACIASIASVTSSLCAACAMAPVPASEPLPKIEVRERPMGRLGNHCERPRVLGAVPRAHHRVVVELEMVSSTPVSMEAAFSVLARAGERYCVDEVRVQRAVYSDGAEGFVDVAALGVVCEHDAPVGDDDIDDNTDDAPAAAAKKFWDEVSVPSDEGAKR